MQTLKMEKHGTVCLSLVHVIVCGKLVESNFLYVTSSFVSRYAHRNEGAD